MYSKLAQVCLGLIVTMAGYVNVQAETCVPKCRSGYTCHEGQCLSKCNPPCATAERCSDAGECVEKVAARPAAPSKKSRPSSTVGGVRAAVMAGIVLPGAIYSDPPDEEIDTTSGLIVRATLDNPVTSRFSAGLYANYISSTAEFGSLSSDFTVISIGGAFKTSITLSETMTIRLGIGVGYQMTSADEVGEHGEDITGFDLAPITELAVKLSNGMTGVVTLTGFSQPSGGNDDATVSWAPIFFLAGGLQFGG